MCEYRVSLTAIGVSINTGKADQQIITLTTVPLWASAASKSSLSQYISFNMAGSNDLEPPIQLSSHNVMLPPVFSKLKS